MNDSIVPQRVCTMCGETFPATTEFFYKQKAGLYGLGAWCKDCSLKRSREAYKANLEKEKERAKRYNSDPEHRAKKKRYDAEYIKQNKERQSERAREYYRENKERIKSRRKYNPERMRISASRYRARKRGLPNTFTTQEWNACLEYFNYCCAVCGCQLRDLLGDKEPHADHWIPISSELCTGTVAKNMICLCNSCNATKQATLPHVWLERKYGKRKTKEILKRVQDYFDSL